MTAAAALLLAILIWASNSIMVLSALLAWIFLGEPVTAAVVVCGLIIAAGVYLVNRA